MALGSDLMNAAIEGYRLLESPASATHSKTPTPHPVRGAMARRQGGIAPRVPPDRERLART